ncbi:MAG: S8 family serine peptidase [Gammaproteobacteria bacterium]|nr:S8 family serine peptidase [Gammaproteobacteria bacterium]
MIRFKTLRTFTPHFLALLITLTLSFSNASLAMITTNGDLALKLKNRPIESIIIKFNKKSSIKNLRQKIDLDLVKIQDLSNGTELFKIINPSLSALELDAKLEQLNSDPDIQYADPNLYAYIQKTPNDSRYTEQWHYYEEEGGMNLPEAWDMTTGSDQIVVGVVDTGIVKHGNIQDKILPGRNFVISKDDSNEADDPTDRGGDTSYHGTHVAGTIAATTDRNGTVSGVSWGAKILPVRVLDDSGSGSFAWINEGMRWAAGIGKIENPNPAKIINLSLGGFGKCPKSLQETIDEIIAKDIIIVVAAGNSSVNAKLFTPANCKGVITVAATNRNGKKTYYTNYGKEFVTIAAPGGEKDKNKDKASDANKILSLADLDNYQFLQGTSMAAPHISGLVALMYSLDPKLTHAQVVEYIKKGARGEEMEVGIADAKKTLELIKSKLPENPENGE